MGLQFSFQYTRTNRAPIDETDVFNSIAEFEAYLDTGAAYAGQICAVRNGANEPEYYGVNEDFTYSPLGDGGCDILSNADKIDQDNLLPNLEPYLPSERGITKRLILNSSFHGYGGWRPQDASFIVDWSTSFVEMTMGAVDLEYSNNREMISCAIHGSGGVTYRRAIGKHIVSGNVEWVGDWSIPASQAEIRAEASRYTLVTAGTDLDILTAPGNYLWMSRSWPMIHSPVDYPSANDSPIAYLHVTALSSWIYVQRLYISTGDEWLRIGTLSHPNVEWGEWGQIATRQWVRQNQSTEQVASPIQNIDLSIEVRRQYQAPQFDRVRLFGRLTNAQADYIHANINNIQLWQFLRRKRNSKDRGAMPVGFPSDTAGSRNNFIHPTQIFANITRPNEATDYVPTSHIFGSTEQARRGLGIGNGNILDAHPSTIMNPQLEGSLTMGMVPTEFMLTADNIKTLADGTKTLVIELHTRHWTDNLAFYTAAVGTPQRNHSIKMVGNQNFRGMHISDPPPYGSLKNAVLAFKFQLVENIDNRRVNGRMTNDTLLAKLRKSDRANWVGPKEIILTVRS